MPRLLGILGTIRGSLESIGTRSGRALVQVDRKMKGSRIGAWNRALWMITGVTLALAGATACKTDGKDKAQPELGEEVGAKNAGLPSKLAATTEPVEPKVPEALPALEGPHFTAFDFLINRPLSHRVELHENKRRVALDASSTDWLRYINGNYPSDWALGLKLEDRVGAGVKGRKANVWFPSWDSAGEQVLELEVHNPAKGDNFLALKLNGKDLEKKKLTRGWQTLRVKVPAGIARAENTLSIDFSNMGRYEGKLSGGALASLRLGPAGAFGVLAVVEEKPAKEAGASDAAKEGSEAVGKKADGASGKDAMAASAKGAPAKHPMTQQGVLELTKGQGLAWHVWAIPGSKIDLEIAAETGCGPVVQVSREGKGGALEVAKTEKRLLVEGRGDKQSTAIDLTDVAGKGGALTRVELWADASCSGPMSLTRASLVVPGEMPTRPKIEPPKHVLFWMIDTLRADHLPFYNKDIDVETPALSKLVDEGAMFSVAYVQGNESKVSHASLFSAMYPSKHRVLARGNLKPHHEIMPEAMKKLGYKTGAHISNGYISEPWGFAQGWDHFVNNLRDGWRIDGMSMAKHAIDWATKNKDERFFLYVGTIDPHVTYRRHEGIIDKYDDDASYTGRYRKYCSGEDLGKIKGGSLKVNDRDKLRIKNLYKNEITFNDQAFGTVRAAFEEMGIWDETMVVITADHGDEFWEHGSVGHGHSVHQDLVHVPLLMYYKPLIEAGTVVHSGADVLDVYPTLVDIAGGERPADLQGRSLVPELLGQHGGYPNPAIATRYLGHYGLQLRHFKLYLRKGDYQLYNRESDPLELEDASKNHPLASRWLLDAAGWFRPNRKEWDKTTWGSPSNLSPEFLALVVGEGEGAKKK